MIKRNFLFSAGAKHLKEKIDIISPWLKQNKTKQIIKKIADLFVKHINMGHVMILNL